LAKICERLILFIDILDNKNIDLLQKKLGLKYNDPENLIQAMTHNSFVNESKDDKTYSNERLEFLGDAVLQLVVTEILFELSPNKSEGDMTIMRSHIVRKETLAEVAGNFGLAKWLRVGKGQVFSEISKNKSILSNTYEALIGSIYIDIDFDTVKSFIHKSLSNKIIEVVNNDIKKDPKSELQEFLQSKKIEKPKYISKISNLEKNIFLCELYIQNELIVSLESTSKTESEILCASEALRVIKDKF